MEFGRYGYGVARLPPLDVGRSCSLVISVFLMADC